MAARAVLALVLGGWLLAVVVDSPKLAGLVSLTLVVGGAVYAGHRMKGWLGAGCGVAGLIAVSFLMRMVLGEDPNLP
jgi:hypothetical protein